jgi:hypothetical protein
MRESQICKPIDSNGLEPTLPSRCQLCLQFGEISPAFMDDDYFPIDDGFARNGERACNLGKALGPVQPVPGVDFFLPRLRCT